MKKLAAGNDVSEILMCKETEETTVCLPSPHCAVFTHSDAGCFYF